jgi:MYXO-CTERM domain-containing protein
MSRRPPVALVVLLLALSPPALAAPTHFVGVNTHLPGTDVLDAVKDLGMSWIRIDVNWFQMQPSQASPPDFSAVDQVVKEASARGLKVFATLAYAPAWAADPDTDGKPNNNVPKPGEFQKFCQAAAAHFNGSITHFGTWNEPNLKDFFEGTEQQWIDRIAIEGIKGIKAGCPSCKTLGPEFSSIGSSYDVWLDDGLKALKKAGLMWDIITWHSYAGFLETKPGGYFCWDGDLFLNDLDQRRNCFGVLGPLSVREVLLNNGLGALDVWMTETGYSAPLADQAKLLLQLTYFRRVLEEQMQRPWYTHTFFYQIVDDPNAAAQEGMATRTGSGQSYPADWTLKPVFKYVKQVLAKAPAYGGSSDACHDLLDDDLDKTIDAAGLDIDGDAKPDVPADPQCTAGATTESPLIPVDAGPRLESGAVDGARREAGAGGDAVGTRDTATTDGSVAVGLEPRAATGSSSGCGCEAASAGPEAASAILVLGLLFLLRRRRWSRD